MSYQSKASATITRPANTTAYAAGDLIANNATAGSVVPVTFNFASPSQNLFLRQLTLKKSQASISNGNFRLWFLSTSPTVTNGDNGVLAGDFLSTALFEPVLVDTTALLTGGGAIGSAIFDNGMLPLPNTCYALLEAMAAYAPTSGEIFTLEATGTPL